MAGPPSASNGNEEVITPNASKSASLKLGKACEACRSLKVRCLFESDSPVKKCKRCARTNQECTITARAPRKQRKRTDTRVGELEQQVENLRAILLNNSATQTERERSTGKITDTVGRFASDGSSNDTARELEPDLTSSDGLGRPLDNSSTTWTGHTEPSSRLFSFNQKAPGLVTEPYDSTRGTRSPGSMSLNDRPRCLTDPEILAKLFQLYDAVMVHHFPLSLFPDSEDAGFIQQTKPTLFLAVVTAAAGTSEPELQTALGLQLTKDLGRRIFVEGEVSLELVQALTIAALFYSPSHNFEKLKYYQYIQMAGTLAMDIGFGRRDPSKEIVSTASVQTWRTPNPETEREQNERNRTVIVCYINCLSVSRNFRRPSMIRSTAAIRESIEALETSPIATPQDHRLICLVRLEQLMEEATVLLNLDTTDATSVVDDLKTQRVVRLFADRLKDWKASIEPRSMYPTLEITYHLYTMIVHEIAFHDGDNLDDFRPPFHLRPPKVPSHLLANLHSARLDSIAASHSSAQSLIKTFLEIPSQTLLVLPSVLFVRVNYAVFIMMKTFFICRFAGNGADNILPITKLYDCLDRIICHVFSSTNNGKCSLTVKFHAIFVRARDWFKKHSERKNVCLGGGDAGICEPLRLLTVYDVRDREPKPPLATTSGPNLIYESNSQPYSTDPNIHPEAASSYTDKSGWVPPSQTTSRQQQYGWDAAADSANTAQYSQATDLGKLEQQIGGDGFGTFQSEAVGLHDTDFPLNAATDTIAESIDFSMGFDFDTQLMDFEFGDMGFGAT